MISSLQAASWACSLSVVAAEGGEQLLNDQHGDG
jgi:hypothetical protein